MKEKKKGRALFSSSRSRSRAARFEERIKPVWQADVNFEDGCRRFHYFDTNLSLCILALKYQRTFVSYQTGTDKIMAIACYQSTSGFVTLYLSRGEWFSPPAGSVCVIHDGVNHYEYLELKQEHTRVESVIHPSPQAAAAIAAVASLEFSPSMSRQIDCSSARSNQ